MHTVMLDANASYMYHIYAIIVLSTAALLLTTSAFVVVPGSRSFNIPPPATVATTTTTTRNKRRTTKTTTKSSIPTSSSLSFSSNTYNNEAILEDSEGHINPELAQRIWKWEKQQRLNLDLPDFQKYSTRTGLRWVRESVISTMASLNTVTMITPTTSTVAGSVTTAKRGVYDDLIQEGVIALMTALKTFEQKSRPNESFETFAKNKISLALDSFTLERAKGSGTTGTTDKRYPPLSVESTIDIFDPFEPDTHCYYNQDEWEIREGLLLDNGESLDENLQYEGEDQTQSIAASLRDSIPEIDDNRAYSIIDDIMGGSCDTSNSIRSTGTSPDNAALADMILYNVDGFLGKSLDETETQIIQMRYGLDEEGEPKSLQEISYDLNLSSSRVRKLQKAALGKLRANFTERYVTDDTGHEDYWEDTV